MWCLIGNGRIALERADDPPQQRLLEDGVGEHRQVGRARVVALVDDAGDRAEVGAAQAHRARLSVHHRDEAVLRLRDVLGERDRGVVARREQQAVQQRQLRDALPERQQARLPSR